MAPIFKNYISISKGLWARVTKKIPMKEKKTKDASVKWRNRNFWKNSFWLNRNLASQMCGLCLVAQWCPTLCDSMDCSLPGSSVHGDSSRKNTGVGCHALFRELFPAQGLNPGLLHGRQILYRLSHQGSLTSQISTIKGKTAPGLFVDKSWFQFKNSINYSKTKICFVKH